MSEELTIAYMLGSKKANDRLKVLQDYVRRLEKEFIYLKIADVWDDTYLPGRNAIRHRERAQEVAQAALEKIRRGQT